MSKIVSTEMAYGWKGTNRFEIYFDGTMDVNQTSNTSADFRLRGTWKLVINNVGSGTHVIYPASDYMIFVAGDQDYAATGSGSTSDAYKATLPYGINANTSKAITETRVDSYRYDLSACGGTIWNRSGGGISWKGDAGTYTCSVDESYTLPLNGSGEQIVLRYFASGSDSSEISWIVAQYWNTLVTVQDFVDEGTIMFDYRPGERLIDGSWKSHNRGSGVCERLDGGWYEMRTKDGGTANADPPEVRKNSAWVAQAKLGEE